MDRKKGSFDSGSQPSAFDFNTKRTKNLHFFLLLFFFLPGNLDLRLSEHHFSHFRKTQLIGITSLKLCQLFGSVHRPRHLDSTSYTIRPSTLHPPPSWPQPIHQHEHDTLPVRIIALRLGVTDSSHHGGLGLGLHLNSLHPQAPRRKPFRRLQISFPQIQRQIRPRLHRPHRPRHQRHKGFSQAAEVARGAGLSVGCYREEAGAASAHRAEPQGQSSRTREGGCSCSSRGGSGEKACKQLE